MITIDLTTASAEAAQRTLFDLCDGMKGKGLIGSYSFEIETPDGSVTDRCVLSGGESRRLNALTLPGRQERGGP